MRAAVITILAMAILWGCQTPPPNAPNPFDRAEVTISEDEAVGDRLPKERVLVNNDPDPEKRTRAWLGITIIGLILMLVSGATGLGLDVTTP